MNSQQHISHKQMDGYDLFRIHDVIDGKLTNLRGVRLKDAEYSFALQLTKEEEAFMHSEEDIHLYAGDKTARVISTLANHESAVEKHIQAIMEATAYVNPKEIEVRTIAGHTYALTMDDRDLGSVRIDYTFGAEDGRIVHYGPVPEEMNITSLVLELIENPYKGKTIYQVGPSEYLTTHKHMGVYISVPLFLHEDEDGKLAWASDAKYFRYFLLEDGQATLIDKPDTVFPKEKDAQAFMEEVTKQVTEVVLKNMEN